MTAQAPRPQSLRRTPAPELSTPCPWCRAPANQRCATPRGRRLTTSSHPARRTAWATASNQQTGDDK